MVRRLNRKQPADYQVTASHTHYFRGDYSLHVRPQYNFDVRLASTRTKKCEYGNKENLKTYFTSAFGHAANLPLTKTQIKCRKPTARFKVFFSNSPQR